MHQNLGIYIIILRSLVSQDRSFKKEVMPLHNYTDALEVLFQSLEERERHDHVALEDLPRLLPDMKFDKFEFEALCGLQGVGIGASSR